MADYFTIKHATYVDRLGETRAFDMKSAPYMSARSAHDDLDRFILRDVVAEIVRVPAALVAARLNSVRAS